MTESGPYTYNSTMVVIQTSNSINVQKWPYQFFKMTDTSVPYLRQRYFLGHDLRLDKIKRNSNKINESVVSLTCHDIFVSCFKQPLILCGRIFDLWSPYCFLTLLQTLMNALQHRAKMEEPAQIFRILFDVSVLWLGKGIFVSLVSILSHFDCYFSFLKLFRCRWMFEDSLHQCHLVCQSCRRLSLQMPCWLDGKKLRYKYQWLCRTMPTWRHLYRFGQRLPLCLSTGIYRSVFIEYNCIFYWRFQW